MAKIRWTAEAEKWLREIYDYIAQDNEKAAQRVIAGIYERVQILKDFPVLPVSLSVRLPTVPAPIEWMRRSTCQT